MKSKLQWESEARERAEDQIRQYKEEVRMFSEGVLSRAALVCAHQCTTTTTTTTINAAYRGLPS